MTSSLYLSTTEARSGKSLVVLGILDLILKKTTRIAYFRPIIQDPINGKHDNNIILVLENFRLQQTYTDSFGLYFHEAVSLAGEGAIDEVLDRILAKYRHLADQVDFILCEGSDYLGEESAFEFNLNTKIAKMLNCPILLLGNAMGNTIEDSLQPIEMALNAYGEQFCQVVGVIINRVQPQLVPAIQAQLEKLYGDRRMVLGTIPQDTMLKSLRLREIVSGLNAQVLSGADLLDNLVYNHLVVAMHIAHALHWLHEKNTLVITPGDRGDIILGVMQAHRSLNYPSIAGILLTADYHPEPAIMKLIEGLPDAPPLLLTSTHTHETSARLEAIHPALSPTDNYKIRHSIALFQRQIDGEKLLNYLKTIRSQGVTPKLFLYNLVQAATATQRHIVLPEGEDVRILKAAASLTNHGIVRLTLLGNIEAIEQAVKINHIDLDLGKVRLMDPKTSPDRERYAETYYQLRKHKGVTLAMARDTLTDISYFGTMMVYLGEADGMVSGSVNTTQHTVRPALQIIKTQPGFSLVSSVFFMCLEDRVLVYGDCAVNPDPNAEQLAEIALSSAATARNFGIEPKVALLSYSSGSSAQGADVEKVRQATAIAKEREPDLALAGPIQYDAAVDPTVAAQKMPGSAVAGQATVFIFPDLNTGNNTYKAVQRETKAIAIGPILQGLNKPVNDLSRGCLVEDIINTVVITALQVK
ncbi:MULTISPECIES: phosphate acetyltransferase [unclassified Synechocystis]|uniref:phosphate acetyltransferase n=1 Tax=unclassified Synechocystis TaxID=2640012 RepID=UPI0004228439|nr:MULTISPECIES: phosphate acetyltransferase [unclassified Synechocystis]AIE73626.1 Phosphate acetyltransferase [Synechocystis sp. PCC 6714]MCT0254986.1 phosphate acetyltransferase [Synechocystis sp. CS-94]